MDRRLKGSKVQGSKVVIHESGIRNFLRKFVELNAQRFLNCRISTLNPEHGTLNQQPGYTLLEVLVALAIITMILIPTSRFIMTVGRGDLAREKLTAICLLEQEAAAIKAFPDDVQPEKRRRVADREWVVRTESTGGEMKTYTVAAYLFGKRIGEVRFLKK